ncbi:MAG: hypothetical protein KKC66_05725, partial [Candidatus Omnitrophica bacterium]|nr:hypothetical protein [Candidatus Omnitrophota bacterium]MBU1933381.1 hypothetical protein [Candidatus Omnitrophota bacterium]
MRSKLLKKSLSIFVTITFLSTNITYAASSNRSFFKNKKVDYDKLSTQVQDRIQEKKSILKEEDPRAEGRKKEA